MAFTSWSDLLTSMKDDMTSGQWRVKSYEIGDRKYEFRNIEGVDGFMTFFREVEHRAYLEQNSTAAPIGRTYARGAGSW